jgi:hypothetical protein
MKDLNRELFRLRVEFDLIQQVYCSKDEEKHIKQLINNNQTLPDDIHTESNGTHFKYVKADISKEDMDELLLYRQIKSLISIKNSLTFFVVLILISIFFTIFLLNGF